MGPRPGSRARATEGYSHAISSLGPGIDSKFFAMRLTRGGADLAFSLRFFASRIPLVALLYSSPRRPPFAATKRLAYLASLFCAPRLSQTTRLDVTPNSTIRDPLFKHNSTNRSNPVVGTTKSRRARTVLPTYHTDRNDKKTGRNCHGLDQETDGVAQLAQTKTRADPRITQRCGGCPPFRLA